MSTRVRLLTSLVTGVLALGVVGASVAWACTYDPAFGVHPGSGLPGAVVELQGGGFVGEVEIWWEKKNGDRLATTHSIDENGNKYDESKYKKGDRTTFKEKVTIPEDARPGDAVIVATGETYNNNSGDKESASAEHAFEVKEVEPEDSPADESGGSNGSGRSGGSGGSGGSESTDAPGVGQIPGFVPAPYPPGGTAAVGGESRLLPDGDRISPIATSDRPGSAPTGATRSRNSSGQSLFGGSVPPPSRPAASDGDRTASADGAGARGGTGSRVADGPSERSAAGDLWSGFGSAESPSLSSPALPAPAEGTGSQLWVGAGLLGFGLVALLGGFGVAEARRRRALTGAPDRG